MAKGDVILKFDGQTAAYVQAVMKSHEAHQVATGSAQKMGEALAHAGEKGKWSMANLKEGAVDLAVGFVGVNSAAQLLEKGVEKVGATFEAYFERMKKKAEELLEKIVSVNAAMGDTGQAESSPEARKAIQEVVEMRPGGRPLGSKEVTDTYVAITRAVGNAVDAKESTRVAEKGRAAGMSAEGAQQLGIIHAQLEREGITGERAENMAFTAATNKLGDLNFRTFFRAGGDENALNLMVAASRVSEGQRKVDSILNLTEDASPEQLKEWKKHRSKHANELAIQAMPHDQRLAAILSRPELAPATDRAAVASIADAMKKAHPANLDEAIAKKRANTDDEGRAAAEAHAVEVIKEEGMEKNALSALQKKNRWDRSLAEFQKNHELLGGIPYLKEYLAVQDEKAFQASQDQKRQQAEDSALGSKVGEYGRDILTAIHGTLQSIEKKFYSNPALKNDSEGQK